MNYSSMDKEEVFAEVYRSDNDLAKRVLELYEYLEQDILWADQKIERLECSYEEGYEDARSDAIRLLEMHL